MTIYGLYGDDAVEKFAPWQFVTIYDGETREHYCEATMETLPEEVRDDLEGYFLEPTDEEGQPISLKEALERGAAVAGPARLPGIELRRSEEAGLWTATYSEGARTPDGSHTILELFGTHTLPTAFTLRATAEEVREEVERLHPGFTVSVIEEAGRGAEGGV